MLLAFCRAFAESSSQVAPLPPGIKAQWDVDKAFHERTPTRERISINGLWRWQPSTNETSEVPSETWGFFKVPACWPGVQDYMQNDYQTLYPHSNWASANLKDVRAAWYQRSITIPEAWSGRRVVLNVEYLNSYAAVYIDGKRAGEMRFPSGQVDLSEIVKPGATHILSLRVVAMPLHEVMESWNDTNTGKNKKGTVERRGLCGDVWLESEPAEVRLSDVKIETSVRRGEITFRAGASGLATGVSYRLRVSIRDAAGQVAEFSGPFFTKEILQNGQTGFTTSWKAPKLWDISTPENQYAADVSIVDASNKTFDQALPVTFAFREFWIDGQDFYLNGSKIHLSLVPLDNAQIGGALSTYEAAKETLRRLKSFGINFVYTHNYNCEPGAHLSFEEILRAADDTGMLVALSQPHFSAYNWKTPGADETNGYALHAAFYTRVAGSHPSVVCYSMSHNATGYNEDTNPQMIDGVGDPRKDEWSSRNAKLALRAEAIVKHLDPSRIVYHHSSGNLGAMYTLNFYLNFVPAQELDDWFEHWSSAGVKPLMLVEYGVPFGWDWTMYRGWYDGKREFGSAPVPWEYCMAEWNSQFLGDSAWKITDLEKRDLRWEAEQFRKGRLWHRWDYPIPVGDVRFEEMQPVQEAYTTENWRAFRTWGVSGTSPWEFDRFWKLRDGFQHHRQDLAVDWDNLQRPGFSPDFIDQTYQRFDVAYDAADWIPLPAAKSLLRNNMPLLAWIAGAPEHFTEKSHLFLAGETVAKQLVIINDTRAPVTCEASWTTDIPPGVGGVDKISLSPGEQRRIPLHVKLPANLAPGAYHIEANCKFDNGEHQKDSFALNVLAPPAPRAAEPRNQKKLALFDPGGETAAMLTRAGISATSIDAATDLSPFDVLFIGKKALTLDGPAPSLSRVRDGLKVIVFEQTSAVLEKRLGFRVEEYGLRQVWPRVPDHPLLRGLNEQNLRDWRRTSTLLPATLDYKLSPRFSGAPAVQWCGLEVTRLWRCGNWGSVASVLIEKPPRGDFLPLLDGGYAEEFSPLLEYREGRGSILFCQMDVTERTEADPAALTLLRNILDYAEMPPRQVRRAAAYAGDSSGLAWLKASGVDVRPFNGELPKNPAVLIVGPGGGKEIAPQISKMANWLRNGGRVLALGLDQEEANAFLPDRITMRAAEHIAAYFPPFASDSPFAGVAPADVHNRDPRKLPLIDSGADGFGDGVLAASRTVTFFQLPPFQISDAMDPKQSNLRRTFERTSFALSRILGNLGVSRETPLLERFKEPVHAEDEKSGRFLEGLYLTKPVEWDDPYRFFGW